jgi:two-component system sensor kinase FixL
MAVVDLELRFTRVNEWLSAIPGKPVEALVGRKLEEFYPELAAQIMPWFRQAIDTQEPVLGVEIGVSSGLSATSHQLVSFHPIKDDEGKTQQISIVVQDITAQKRLEEELRTTNEYLDTILLNLPVGVAILEGPDFRYYRINERLAEINGLSVEDHLDKPLAEILPDAAQDILPGLRRVLETGEPILGREFGTRLPKNPDVLRYFVDSFFAVKRANGRSNAIAAVVLDITARKKAEEALQRSHDELEQRVEERTAQLAQSNVALRDEMIERDRVEEALRNSQSRLAEIIDVAADAVVAIDRSQKIIVFNRAAEATFGYSAGEVMGHSLEVLIPPRLGADHRGHVNGFAGSAESSRRMGERQNVIGRRNDGEEFLAEAAISQTEAGDIMTVVLRDISDRKKAEATQLLQRDELAHVLRTATISELTATIAHELNQPLAAIRANAQAGQRFISNDTPDLEEIGEIFDDIVDDNRRAVAVIRHMRSLISKQDADNQPVDINEILRQVIGLVHSDSVIKRVVVDYDLAEDLPQVRGDSVQLQQVCLNLMLNSFDAMQDVPVDERRLVIQTSLEGNKAVCVSMQDTGIGFSALTSDRLFEPFHTTKAAGLGMGLAISRSIVEAHGGKIWGRENPDRGATFQFTVPLAAEDSTRKVAE